MYNIERAMIRHGKQLAHDDDHHDVPPDDEGEQWQKSLLALAA